MVDCNPAATPLPPGYEPSTAPLDADYSDIIMAVNKLFHQNFTSYNLVTTKYKSIVAGLGWWASMTGLIMKLPVSLLSRSQSAPDVAAFKAAKMAMRFAKGRIGTGMVLKRTDCWGPGQFPQYIMFTDASYADDLSNCKSQVGYVGGFEGMAATTAASGQPSVRVNSTRHAEQYAASFGAREAVYKRQWHAEVGITVTRPTPMYVDNQATVQMHTGAPVQKFSKLSKHFRVYELYVTDCCLLGEITLIKISGKDTAADAQTKSLQQRPFERHLRTIEEGPLETRG